MTSEGSDGTEITGYSTLPSTIKAAFGHSIMDRAGDERDVDPVLVRCTALLQALVASARHLRRPAAEVEPTAG